MTTIAFRQGVLATDTQMSYGSTQYTVPGIKLFYAGSYAVGFAGDIRYGPLVKRWFDLQCPLGVEEYNRLWDDGWDIIAMDRHGHLHTAFADVVYPLDNQFYAIGSGSHYALGAMHMGASAVQAVAAAARFDVDTNAVIEHISAADLRNHLANDL